MEQKYSKSSNYTVLGPKKLSSIAVHVLDLQEINEQLKFFFENVKQIQIHKKEDSVV